jgi:hypothetical protein
MNEKYNFSFKCPHCHAPIQAANFTQDHFTVAYLQEYFQTKETEYKSQLLLKMGQEIENFPLFQQLKAENEKLKLIVEGYKLGSSKSSKEKGEDLEKCILEKLQETYNGTDKIAKITHLGDKADFAQEIWQEKEVIGKIIYEVKNVDKWDNKWLEKLEKDMAHDKADIGIIVATCRRGNPLWKPFPHKSILISDDENFIFASQMARLLLLSKQRLNQAENPHDRIKKWEEWIKNKLPNYLLNLEKNFSEWEKDLTRINTSLKNMITTRENIQKIVISQIELELKNI